MVMASNVAQEHKLSWSCTRVRATPAINTGWGMKGLRAALPRRTWGYWWMKSLP